MRGLEQFFRVDAITRCSDMLYYEGAFVYMYVYVSCGVLCFVVSCCVLCVLSVCVTYRVNALHEFIKLGSQLGLGSLCVDHTRHHHHTITHFHPSAPRAPITRTHANCFKKVSNNTQGSSETWDALDETGPGHFFLPRVHRRPIITSGRIIFHSDLCEHHRTHTHAYKHIHTQQPLPFPCQLLLSLLQQDLRSFPV